MKKPVKFATQLDETVLRKLKSFTDQQDKKISFVVNAAVAEYLQKYQVRPAFKDAMDRVIHRNEKLLKKLAS